MPQPPPPPGLEDGGGGGGDDDGDGSGGGEEESAAAGGDGGENPAADAGEAGAGAGDGRQDGGEGEGEGEGGGGRGGGGGEGGRVTLPAIAGASSPSIESSPPPPPRRRPVPRVVALASPRLPAVAGEFHGVSGAICEADSDLTDYDSSGKPLNAAVLSPEKLAGPSFHTTTLVFALNLRIDRKKNVLFNLGRGSIKQTRLRRLIVVVVASTVAPWKLASFTRAVAPAKHRNKGFDPRVGKSGLFTAYGLNQLAGLYRSTPPPLHLHSTSTPPPLHSTSTPLHQRL